MNKARKLGFQRLEDRRMLSVSFDLLRDINTSNSFGAAPTEFVTLDGRFLFAGNDEFHGRELRTYDGTTAGIQLLTDINPGSGSSDPRGLLVVDDVIYFTASDAAHGRELWRTDGTAEGTWMVKDIHAGLASSDPENFYVHAGLIYFAASDESHGKELWRTDGTTQGTTLVADIAAGATSSTIANFAELNGRLYVLAEDDQEDWEVWSISNAVSHASIAISIPAIGGGEASELVTAGNRLYFVATLESGASTKLLWRSDGTQAGTNVLINTATLNPSQLFALQGSLYYFSGSSSSWSLSKDDGVQSANIRTFDGSPKPTYLALHDGSVYFSATTRETGTELWRSNGTLEGTSIVIDAIRGASASSPRNFQLLNGRLFFTADTSSQGASIFRVSDDGSSATPFAAVGVGDPLSELIEVGGGYAFLATVGVNGNAPNPPTLLHVGYEGGATTKLSTATPSGYTGGKLKYARLGDSIYYAASLPDSGYELHVTDGTADGTRLVDDLLPYPNRSAELSELTELDDRLYFIESGEVWTSDGTMAGTVKLTLGEGGGPIEEVYSLTAFEGRLYFLGLYYASANASIPGVVLYVSDGTSAGTSELKILSESAGGIGSLSRAFFTPVDGLLYFRGLRPTGGNSYVWRTDGTAVGTFSVRDRDAPAGNLFSRIETAVDDVLYFYGQISGSGSVAGYELWRSDGTDAGTYMVKDIRPGATSSKQVSNSADEFPYNIAAIGNQIVFFANDGTRGSELWVSDGTETGTRLLKDINPGSGSSSVDTTSVYRIGDRVVFFAYDATGVRSLWETDGSEEGTRSLLSWNQRTIQNRTMVDGSLFFTGDDADGGLYLWTLGPEDSAPTRYATLTGLTSISGLTPVGNAFYFSANDGLHGQELWRVAGKSATAELAFDAYEGVGSGSPTEITQLGNRLVLAVTTPRYGKELWLSSPLTRPGDYNEDGVVSPMDYMVWRNAYGLEGLGLAADGNFDGKVDAADYSIWRDHLNAEDPTPIPGDYNRDGAISAEDHTVWHSSYGQSGGSLAADGNSDGRVDAADYTVWRDIAASIEAVSQSHVAGAASNVPTNSLATEARRTIDEALASGATIDNRSQFLLEKSDLRLHSSLLSSFLAGERNLSSNFREKSITRLTAMGNERLYDRAIELLQKERYFASRDSVPAGMHCSGSITSQIQAIDEPDYRDAKSNWCSEELKQVSAGDIHF